MGIVTSQLLNGCQKDDEEPVFEAEGYIIGHHPCVGSSTVSTGRGEGKGYLVATTGSNSDTLMVFGVPMDMFEVPEEWYSSLTPLFPAEGGSVFKMRFSYRKSDENMGLQFPCIAYPPIDNLLQYAKPEYIHSDGKKN